VLPEIVSSNLLHLKRIWIQFVVGKLESTKWVTAFDDYDVITLEIGEVAAGPPLIYVSNVKEPNVLYWPATVILDYEPRTVEIGVVATVGPVFFMRDLDGC